MRRTGLRDERGSVTGVTLVLVSLTVMIGMAIAEVAWAQYIRHTAQEAAEIAAEAGSRSYETYARVSITRYHLELQWYTVCDWDVLDDEGNPECWEQSRVVRTWSYPEIEAREDVLAAQWPELLECHADPWEGWACVGIPQVVPPERVNRRLEFTVAESVARSTFLANWRNRRSTRLMEVHATPVAASGSVAVLVRIRYSPLFLPFLESRDLWVRGRALVQMKPLSF